MFRLHRDKILRIKAENSSRRLTAVEREGSAQKFPALPSRRVSLKLRARARVYFARLTIAIAKVGDYSQSKVRAGVLADLDPPNLDPPVQIR